MPTACHAPDINRWILTITLRLQVANPSATETDPRATSAPLSRSETDRLWITAKLLELVAVPLGVVTEMGPVVAPAGTVAVIWVAEFTANMAERPFNFTAVAPVRFVPVMVTVVPTFPEVGEKLEMVGVTPPDTVKLVLLVPVPLGVVTEMRPVVAPVGTEAMICVGEVTEKVDAATLLNLTEVTPTKFVPVMVTMVPTGPEVGENDVMVGAPTTVKSVELVPVPLALVKEIGPVVAAGGTVAVICVEEFTVKGAALPWNLTAVTPMKFVPMIVTEVPTRPLVGVNEVMVGAPAAVTVKFVELVAVPFGFVTEIGPVIAPDGTVALMDVDELIVNVADVFLNFTSVTSQVLAGGAQLKFVPVIVTKVPAGPLPGVKEVMVGAPAIVTVKFVELVAVPPKVVTEIGPVVAPTGTVVVIVVEEFVVNAAGAFLNFTPVTSTKFVPVMMTDVPTGPEVGENDVIVGAAAAAGPARTMRSANAMMNAPATRRPVDLLADLMVPPPQKVLDGETVPPFYLTRQRERKLLGRLKEGSRQALAVPGHGPGTMRPP